MRNYIGNNNEINKKKYKKSLPPKLNPDAGNVEYNIDMFNKASSGDANLSSAAGMNGIAESYDRDSLIARITEFGKHYNFDKYTDAQLNAMLNRLVDASNHKKKVLPKHQNTIDIQSERHIMNDDPSYNFDDSERQGEYRVENLREALNRLDHYCIDNDKIFYDLRSLYENIQHQLTPQEKVELRKLVDTTNDPDAIKAYIDSKDPQKKNEELDESISNWQDAYAIFINIVNKYLPDVDRIETEVENIYLKNAGDPAFDKAYQKWIEEYGDDIDVEEEEDSMAEADWTDETDVDFDESLKESVDNLTYDELIDLAHKYYKQGGMEIIEFWDENSLKEYEKEFGPMTKKQAIRLMKVMGNVSKDEEEAGKYFSDTRGFEESLNEEDEFYTRLISDNAGSALQKFMNVDEPDITYDNLRNAVEEFRIDLEKFPKNDLDIKYDCDKDRFYRKYKPFADTCKRLKNSLRPTGYGKSDFVDVKKKELCNAVLNRFPYGWKVYKGAADRQLGNSEFNESFCNEGLNRKELETFSRAIFNAGDKEEAIEIIDQIYQYDKKLSLQLKDMWDERASVAYNTDKLSGYLLRYFDESLNEDTVKQGSKWVNKGKEGTHGKFKTKKAADAQRKAMFANGYKGESLQEDNSDNIDREAMKAVKQICKTHGKEVPQWQIQSIMQEYPQVDAKKIYRWVNKYSKIYV